MVVLVLASAAAVVWLQFLQDPDDTGDATPIAIAASPSPSAASMTPSAITSAVPALTVVPATETPILASPVVPESTGSSESLQGRDPKATNCDKTADTLATADITDDSGRKIGFVELRYSRECFTYWASLTTDDGLSHHELAVFLVDDQTQVISTTYFEIRFNSAYGNMWASDDLNVRVRACGKMDGYEACTPLRR